ncbi:MAG: hypothetical protein WC091_25755, partial [Sulfuricellaceae bacterium]
HKSQRKSIEAVCKIINKQLAVIDRDMDSLLKKHFADKVSLLSRLRERGFWALVCNDERRSVGTIRLLFAPSRLKRESAWLFAKSS